MLDVTDAPAAAMDAAIEEITAIPGPDGVPVEKAARLGYGAYRLHLDFMDLVADRYSFGGHARRRFAETIKDRVDPDGILSPGKQGIRPSAYRT